MAIIAGAVLTAAGVVLIVPLPEVGLPLVVGGLRLLGRRYRWAARANARVDAVAVAAGVRWRRSSRLVKIVVVALVVLVVAGLGWWALAG